MHSICCLQVAIHCASLVLEHLSPLFTSPHRPSSFTSCFSNLLGTVFASSADPPLITCKTKDFRWSCMTCSLCSPLLTSILGCMSHIYRNTCFHGQFFIPSYLHRHPTAANAPLITSKTQDMRWFCLICNLCWPHGRFNKGIVNSSFSATSIDSLQLLMPH